MSVCSESVLGKLLISKCFVLLDSPLFTGLYGLVRFGCLCKMLQITTNKPKPGVESKKGWIVENLVAIREMVRLPPSTHADSLRPTFRYFLTIIDSNEKVMKK